ncbi:integrase core domain-containing protein [Hymenobacter mellowenesis]|uniref:integrase core domain-containing protein n=1 Tax=Hymenobacter mellowenesis TaxID=3063995 RepID=UPI00350F4B8B
MAQQQQCYQRARCLCYTTLLQLGPPVHGHPLQRPDCQKTRGTASRSRRGNGYDNAHAESFRNRFKAELPDGGYFPVLAEARLEISRPIACYNAERQYSSPGYLALSRFETQLQTKSQLCPA